VGAIFSTVKTRRSGSRRKVWIVRPKQKVVGRRSTFSRHEIVKLDDYQDGLYIKLSEPLSFKHCICKCESEPAGAWIKLYSRHSKNRAIVLLSNGTLHKVKISSIQGETRS
jgi:hypothetical protein